MPLTEKIKRLKLQDFEIKILIVDDEKMVAESLSRVLSKNYSVLIANNVEDALDLFDQHQPQIILTDHIMPKKTGIDLLNIIRKKAPGSVRIIMTSFKKIEELKHQMEKGLIYYYINKPINVENLKNVIHRGALEYVAELNRIQLINTIKNKNAELIKKNVQLEEMNKMKTEFLRNLSHRISTPLSGILAQSELITLRKDLSKHQIIKTNESIFGNAITLSTIIQNLLALGKLETGHFEFYFSVFSIDQLIAKATHGFELLLKRKQLSFEIVNESGEAALLSDFEVLVLILRNILNNAIHYSTEASTVKLKISRSAHQISFKVKNRGPIITKEDKIHLFDKFSSFYHEEDQLESVGIGLAVSKLLLTQLKGDISYTSQEEKGTQFKISIPHP